jgi:hypothetical protein
MERGKKNLLSFGSSFGCDIFSKLLVSLIASFSVAKQLEAQGLKMSKIDY